MMVDDGARCYERKGRVEVVSHAPGRSARAIHRRDPATAPRGSFWLLGFPPGPVRPSLDDLVATALRHDRHIDAVLSADARSTCTHAARYSRPQSLPPPGLQATGLQARVTTPSRLCTLTPPHSTPLHSTPLHSSIQLHSLNLHISSLSLSPLANIRTHALTHSRTHALSHSCHLCVPPPPPSTQPLHLILTASYARSHPGSTTPPTSSSHHCVTIRLPFPSYSTSSPQLQSPIKLRQHQSSHMLIQNRVVAGHSVQTDTPRSNIYRN